VRLKLSSKFAAGSRKRITQIVVNLPHLVEKELRIIAHPQLTDYRGKLLSGYPDLGTEIYAAAFIRQRLIVLESALLRQPELLKVILTHEVFHFVWVRLSNKARREFSTILRAEMKGAARGELGESSSIKKSELHPRDHMKPGSKRWKEYVCESFCDTAAWLYSESEQAPKRAPGKQWRMIRQGWFLKNFPES
jgi:hypothetical protein